MDGFLMLHSCLFVQLIDRVEPGDYLNTFAFLDKLAENLTKKQAQSRL